MKKIFLVCLTAILFSAVPVFGDQFDVMCARFSGVSQALHGVVFGNGAYVAVGDGGVIVSSTDSVTWTPQISGTTNALYGIDYTTNEFVAVGNDATILTSTNGINWVPCACPVTNELSAVTYGLGRYVAVGAGGTIVTSTNGVNWSSVSTGSPYNFNGVDFTSFNQQYPNNIFVVVGDSGTIMTSPDGLVWTIRSSGTFLGLKAVAIYSQNSETYDMAAVGDSGTVETSADGINWTREASGTAANLLAVAHDHPAYGAGAQFGAVGQDGVFLTSSSGWQVQTTATASNLDGLVNANGNFLAVGDAGVIQAAIDWKTQTLGSTVALNAVAYGAGEFMAAGAGNGTNLILSSTDGHIWSTVYTGTAGDLLGVTRGGNEWVAVGADGIVVASADGVDWNSQNLGATNSFDCVIQGNGVYVALGEYTIYEGPSAYAQPVACQSTDGVNWSGPWPSLPLEDSPAGIAFGNGLFVGVGANGAIATSLDGITWAAQNSSLGQNDDLGGIIFANGIFVATYGSGVITSSDGTNWVANSPGAAGALAFGSLGFVTPGVSTSADGTNWTGRPLDGPTGGIAFGNGIYVIGGGSEISQIIPANSQAEPLLQGQSSIQGFQLSATAEPGYNYRIQSSTNLVDWSDIDAFTSTQIVTAYTDSNATNFPQGFYRIVSP